MDNVLTVEEVAHLLKVKPITVREMLREQRIRGFKVGKAWRTTESMLSEDLETIARGEKPEPLEAQRLLAALPKRTGRGRKPGTAKAAPAAKVKAKPAAEDGAVAQTPKPKPGADRKSKADKKPEDQQLLF